MHSELFSLLLITFLAAAAPLLASRVKVFRLPIVVGEILAGIIIGKSGFDLVQPTETLEFLAEFGFIFLMFLSGLELNPQELTTGPQDGREEAWYKRPVWLVVFSFLLTVVLALGCGLVMSSTGLVKNGLFMGLILSTTSLGIVVPVLKESGQMGRSYGQVVLLGALIGDFVTLLLLSLAIALAGKGPSFELLFFLVLGVLFILSVRFGRWIGHFPRLTRTLRELSHATAQLRVRGALALMVAWAFLAQHLGIEIILGAFLAGAFISLSSADRSSPLWKKLEAIGYGFFIPVFFINVGADFELASLLGSPKALLLLPVLIAASYLVKIVPALILKGSFGWRKSIAAGVLLSSRLSLIIAAAAIAVSLDMIDAASNSAVILVAVVTCTLSPILFYKLISPFKEKQRNGVIFVGGGQLAEFLGRRLIKNKKEVVFISPDEEESSGLEKAGFKVVPGNPADPEVLRQAGAATAEALIDIGTDEETSRLVCPAAIRDHGVPKVICLAHQRRLALDLKKEGVEVIEDSLATAFAIEGALFFPAAYEALADLNSGVDLLDAAVRNPDLINRRLGAVAFPPGVQVMSLHRRQDLIIPNESTFLLPNDVLTLVGPSAAVLKAKALIEKNGSRGEDFPA